MTLVLAHCDYCGKELSWRVGSVETSLNLRTRYGALEICKSCNRIHELQKHTFSFDSIDCLLLFITEGKLKLD